MFQARCGSSPCSMARFPPRRIPMNQIESDDDGETRDIRSLLEAVYRHCGYDFRDYAYPSIGRRIWNSVRTERLQTIPELTRKLLDEPVCMERFLKAVTVNVTAMFR